MHDGKSYILTFDFDTKDNIKGFQLGSCVHNARSFSNIFKLVFFHVFFGFGIGHRSIWWRYWRRCGNI